MSYPARAPTPRPAERCGSLIGSMVSDRAVRSAQGCFNRAGYLEQLSSITIAQEYNRDLCIQVRYQKGFITSRSPVMCVSDQLPVPVFRLT